MRDLTEQELTSLISFVNAEISKTQQSIKLYRNNFTDQVMKYLQDSINYYEKLKSKLEERRKELEGGRD